MSLLQPLNEVLEVVSFAEIRPPVDVELASISELVQLLRNLIHEVTELAKGCSALDLQFLKAEHDVSGV